tara:strand:+ start:2290 stop:3054 length:765 start_codon:yes stop_codon:yes gene_type:complete
MLKIRLIPILLWNGFTLVKGEKFINQRKTGSPITTIKIYNSRDVDEIIFFDISGSNLEKIDSQLIKSITDCVSVPITIGGGINKISQMDELFENGADKICINSAMYENPKIIYEASNKYGSQSVTVSIDVKKYDNDYLCFYKNGTVNSKKKVIDCMKECIDNGAGEIVINSIEYDGLMKGYDLDLIKKISKFSKVPIIAAGGAGNYNDFYEAYINGANAFAAASIYHFTECTPTEAKKFLIKKNVPIRKNYNLQ